MLSTRPGAPAGIRPGPWRKLTPGAKLASVNPNPFPAPVWVTLVVRKKKFAEVRTKTREQLFPKKGRPTKAVVPQSSTLLLVVDKRIALNRRIKTQSKFVKPTTTVVIVVSTRVKPIRVVKLLSQRKTKTQVVFTEKFGKPTSPRKVVGPLVKQQRNLKRPSIKTQLGKPTKTVVVVVTVKPKGPKVLLQQTRRRSITKSHLGKLYGKPTTKTAVRGPRILSYIARQAEKKARYIPVRIVVGKIPRTFGSSPTGSTVIFFDGLNVAGGLNYHKDLSRPHLILVNNGDGTFTVFKDRSLTDEKADSVLKETYLINGDIP